MKIIDFRKFGNVVRFYFGEDDLERWYGDDWDDRPYEHNAGTVYEEFVAGYADVAFGLNVSVLEPCDDWRNNGNSEWSKDDMVARRTPFLVIAQPPEGYSGGLYAYDMAEEYSRVICDDAAIRLYLGDSEAHLEKELAKVRATAIDVQLR